MTNRRYVKTNPKLTKDQFGVNSQEYYEKFIKGKELLVLGENTKFYRVVDEKEEHWSISKEDVRLV